MSVLDTESVRAPDSAHPRGRWYRPGSIDAIALTVVVVVLARGWLLDLVDSARALTKLDASGLFWP